MAVDANVVPEVTEAISGWMNETTLYYTYSTIAQTLAGAFGILGAFTLFHLQSINRSLKGICQIIYESLLFPSVVQLSFYREDWSSFLDDLNEYITDEKFQLGQVNMEKSLHELLKVGLKHDINYKKQVIKHLKIVAYLTAIAIILSLVALPFVPKLVNPFFSKVLLGLTVGLSIGCVYNYILIVISAISHKVYKTNIGDTTNKKIKKAKSKVVETIKSILSFWGKR